MVSESLLLTFDIILLVFGTSFAAIMVWMKSIKTVVREVEKEVVKSEVEP